MNSLSVKSQVIFSTFDLMFFNFRMPAFIRVTWIDVDDEEKRNLENQYKKTLGLAINLKEFRNGAHIQEKGTIDLKMNGQFDSHLYEVS